MPRRNKPTKRQRRKRQKRTIYIKLRKNEALKEQDRLDEYGF